MPGGLQYRGEYLVAVGAELAALHGPALASDTRGIAAPEHWIDLVRDHTIAAMMREVREDLAALGVVQEVFTSERALVATGAADATDRAPARRTG